MHLFHRQGLETLVMSNRTKIYSFTTSQLTPKSVAKFESRKSFHFLLLPKISACLVEEEREKKKKLRKQANAAFGPYDEMACLPKKDALFLFVVICYSEKVHKNPPTFFICTCSTLLNPLF